MGEAARRRDAYATGKPWRRSNKCPGCGSLRIRHFAPSEFPEPLATTMREHGTYCEHAYCVACGALWEAFPAMYAEDPVCSEPCDNCAFRPGSPEQSDTEGWKRLLDRLRPGVGQEWFAGGRFYCHKGVPIDLDRGPGNFKFPRKPVMMDGEPVRQPDGTVVTTEDLAKMRTCSGYLRARWAWNRKRPAFAEGDE